MPFRRLRLRQFYTRLGVSLLAGLLSVLLGVLIISWQTFSGVKQDAEERLLHARHMFDRTLDNAQQAASMVRSSMDRPCDEVVQGLRDQVATVPDIRTVNLARGEHIYCTSLYGSYSGLFSLADYAEGQLDLLRGNPVTPDRPLVVYRQAVGDNSVLVGVDGYYLHNILDMLSRNSPLALVIGSRTMQANGQVSEEVPSRTGGYLEQVSSKYPFRVVTDLSHNEYGSHVWSYSRASLIIYPLLGILVGVGVFWLTGRSTSPSQELRRALAQREFIPYLQPVVTGDDGHWCGCEVLMRWQHPRQGMISPDRFIPLAEDSGLIVPMTRLLMAQVRDQFAGKAHTLPRGFHFGFNICASHCKDLSLVEDCRDFIDGFKANPIKLVLELTERELIVADEVTDRLFAELHQLGVFIAIDDFGTGHSSLTYLQQFQVDFLKIDQSFVGMIGSDALSSHIVENVIDLATRLGLMLVAEGVENEVQAAYLRARQVTFLQGYFYGRPMPMKEFAKQLAA
ncbi:TPA: cyclic diguanylate phosphodiesterase [Aeromonas salmonicida]|uniref:EAL domain-containing protein n=1 Tax=Aeromonas salmonicida TaxID=645 RepID=UPI0007300692|nr:cyclic diguanylate phosphodiesterase [Aeromonas salmonicida]MBP6141163.1 cyclic diguanylate phosphodiesterase [Aeromonas sp.]KTA74547.1 diguanylate phosphodiesterase [Aeromonas salmonicida]MBP8051043.1 cyclic diguanylate phosphodiesterase [Aeromonas sp.]RSM21277.1 cyclic diguanylate phosphodiesterase [Aeromonas salmonicida]VFB08203.1 EAL domain-containing protein [Aeromonas salmonicida]